MREPIPSGDVRPPEVELAGSGLFYEQAALGYRIAQRRSGLHVLLPQTRFASLLTVIFLSAVLTPLQIAAILLIITGLTFLRMLKREAGSLVMRDANHAKRSISILKAITLLKPLNMSKDLVASQRLV